MSEQRPREEKLHPAILRYISDIVWVANEETIIEYESPSCSRILGYESDFFVGRTGWEFVHPDDMAVVEEIIHSFLKKERSHIPVEFRFKHADGHWVWLEAAGDNQLDNSEIRGLVVTLRDVTKRRQKYTALRECESMYHALFQKSGIGMIKVDLNGRIIEANATFCDMTRYSEQELDMMNIENLMHSDFEDEIREMIQSLFEGEIARFQFKGKAVRKGGVVIWARCMATLMIDDEGRPMHALGMIEDITPQVLAEDTLRENEEKFRLLAYNIPDVLWISDPDGGSSFISPNVEKVYGYTREEIYERGEELWFGRVHPDDLEIVKGSYAHLFEEGKEFSIEYRIKHKDGNYIWLHDRAISRRQEKGIRVAYGVFSDVTARKRSEEKQRELFLELQHRVKNNLQLISSIVDMEKMRLDDDELKKTLDDVKGVVHTMALIHSNAYGVWGLKEINLKMLLDQLLEEIIGIYRTIDVVDYSVTGDSLSLNIDQASPVSLMVNELAFNALKHAFRGRKKGFIGVDVRHVGNNIELRVKDDGIGLPEGFSIDGAQSLGLKLVKALVRQLDGKLEINRNDGTEFLVTFPLIVKENEGEDDEK